MIITSTDNLKIKNLIRLKKAGKRREQGLIIIDGAREINLAFQSGLEIQAFFYCPDLFKDQTNYPEFFKKLEDRGTELSKTVFKKVCYKEAPDGFLALAKPRPHTFNDIKPSQKSLIVILEGLEKPGNLGAILRTTRAAGVDAVIINDNQVNLYHPNVIRASEGQIFTQKIVCASPEQTKNWLKEQQIYTYGATGGAKKNYTEVDLKGAVALVFGSEALGLSDFWLKSADNLIKIPMMSGVDSLNVSVAAAIMIFEAKRQRG